MESMSILARASHTLIAAGAALAAIACAQTSTPVSEQPSEAALIERAKGIHARVVTIDTHDDIPFDFATAEVDPGVRGDRQVDLVKMREGGLDVGFFIVYVGQTERTPEAYARAKEAALTPLSARSWDPLWPPGGQGWSTLPARRRTAPRRMPRRGADRTC